MHLFCEQCKLKTAHTIERDDSPTSGFVKIFEMIFGGFGYSNSHKNMKCDTCGAIYNEDLHETTFFDSSDDI